MSNHAYLPASSAYRWMACTKSPGLSKGIQGRDSPYARQGTDAHTLCAYKVMKALGRDATDPTSDLEYYDKEMSDCSDDYASFVMEQVADARSRCGDPLILIEERLDFSRWVPEAFGTGDCVILSDGVLTIVDYKHGVGVLVSAEHNPQMQCYALGALDTFGCLYDVHTVRMCIYQPRRDNVSIYEMSVDDLMRWADEELAVKARMAWNDEGEFCVGDHCIFCPAKAICRARAEASLQLEEYGFEEPDTLTDDEIAGILRKVDSLTAWASDVKEYALSQALAGKKYEGFKVVEGRAVRKYTDEEAVADAVTAAGYDPYEKKVLGITAMTKLLGRKQFDELLSGFIHKPAGKPVLTATDDERQEMNTVNDYF